MNINSVIAQINDALGEEILSAHADDYGNNLVVKIKISDGSTKSISKVARSFKKQTDVSEYIERLKRIIEEAKAEHK